jgi:transposase
MRSAQVEPLGLLCYITLDDRVPIAHPVRTLRIAAERALEKACKTQLRVDRTFEQNKTFRAMVLQQAYEIKIDYLFIEHANYNLLFRWFIGFTLNEEIWSVPRYRADKAALLEKNELKKVFTASEFTEELKTFSRMPVNT